MMIKLNLLLVALVSMLAAKPAAAQYTGGHEDGYSMVSLQAQVVGIDEREEGDLNVYPNPAQAGDMIIIEGGFQNDVMISITDILGREVTSFRYSSGDEIAFSLAGIRSGIYLVSLEAGGTKRFAKIQIIP